LTITTLWWCNKGVLYSDSILYFDTSSQGIVDTFVADQNAFFNAFVNSMVSLGRLGLKTTANGEIRKNCFVANWTCYVLCLCLTLMYGMIMWLYYICSFISTRIIFLLVVPFGCNDMKLRASLLNKIQKDLGNVRIFLFLLHIIAS
jgi:hypothetical protein